MKDKNIVCNVKSEKQKKEQMSSTVEKNSNAMNKFYEEVLEKQKKGVFGEKENNTKSELKEDTCFVKNGHDVSKKSGFP